MTSTAHDPSFESLLEFLKRGRSFDFTGYKRSTLTRRFQKRMQALGVRSYEEYREFLEVHPGEFDVLFDTILINVTSFFRDADAWAHLAEMVSALVAARGPDVPIRVWSAGCATGEEPYSLAMLLSETLGPEAFRDRVKVYATDLDDDALARARQGSYDERALEELPDGFRQKYFEQSGERWVFRPDLRRQVIFGRHDLVQHAPISHLDVLACRNVMMYFNSEVQGRILARFHFALKSDGVLFLGKAEMMRAHGGLFSPLNLPARIFRKAGPVGVRERVMLLGAPAAPTAPDAARAPLPATAAHQLALMQAALNAQAAAQLLVSPAGDLVMANELARRAFGITTADLGRPLHDLKVSYRPVELRSRIEQALGERRPVYLSNVEHPAGDEGLRTFDVQVCPLGPEREAPLGVMVSFLDVTRYVRLQAEVEQANQALETAFEELQSTNEEMETTNEELQSTVEELETTNEELQSTNEELETMNEELQSTNEELSTLNDELQRRTAALDDANAYLNSVLMGLRAGVVVVDRDMHVQVWNRNMEDMWGLRADEVKDQPLLHLDIGLPVERLKGPVRAVLDGRSAFEEMRLDAVNRRGRPVHCHVTLAPLVSSTLELAGTVVVVEEADPAAAPLA